MAVKLVDGSHNPPTPVASGHPMLSARNIEDDRINWEAPFRRIGDADFAVENRRTHISAGDVLLTIVGSIGRSLAVAPDAVRFALQRSVAVVSAPALSPRFLAYQFRGARFAAFLRQSARGTAQKGVYLGSLANAPILVPPPPEQRRIVDALDSYLTRLDEAEAALERVQLNLERYRAAVLRTAVEGLLVPTEAELARAEGREYEPASELLKRILADRRRRWEESELARLKAAGKAPKDDKWKARYEEPCHPDVNGLPRLPEGWSWASWAQLADRVTVGHVGEMTSQYRERGIPFLRSQNVRENRFDPAGLKYISREFHGSLAKSALAAGDVVIVRSGSVGVACVVPDHLQEANCSDLVIVKQPRGVLPEFGAYFMNSIAKASVRRQQVGIALAHFNTASAAKMPIAVAPLAEQRRAVAATQRLLSVADEIDLTTRAALRRSSRLRQAILKRAFEGKLVDQDPNDEPAAVLLERIRAEREVKEPQRARRGRNRKPRP